MVSSKLKNWRAGKLSGGNLSKLYGVDETALLDHLRKKNKGRVGFNKVFCIGYNKTGTSSLEAVLKSLGLRMPEQILQERLTSHVLVSGRYDALKKVVERYDAFQDMPFSQENLYVALDALFPDSKFILSLRDPDTWYDSLVGYHKKVFGLESPEDLDPDFWRGAKYLHENYTFEQQRRLVTTVREGQIVEDWDALYDRTTRASEFDQRNNEIIRYFRNRPADLLCLDVSKETDTSKICQFLECDATKVTEFPRLNARD